MKKQICGLSRPFYLQNPNPVNIDPRYIDEAIENYVKNRVNGPGVIECLANLPKDGTIQVLHFREYNGKLSYRVQYLGGQGDREFMNIYDDIYLISLHIKWQIQIALTEDEKIDVCEVRDTLSTYDEGWDINAKELHHEYFSNYLNNINAWHIKEERYNEEALEGNDEEPRGGYTLT
jgi:hypothetical protein